MQEVLLRGDAHSSGFLEGHTRGSHPTVVPQAVGADRPGVYRVRIEHATPHMLYGRTVDTAGHDLPLIPATADTARPEAAALTAPLPMA